MTDPGSAVNCSTVLLRRPDGRILVQLRDNGGGKIIPFPNTWNFPGGAVEPNETHLEAAVRETWEEFQVRLEPSGCRLIWRYQHAHSADDHVFLCDIGADVEPVLCEGAGLAWMTVPEIGQLELGFDQAKILPHLP